MPVRRSFLRAAAFRFDRSTRAPPFREDFSASVDRVSPGFESMSGNYLSLLYRPSHRPPLDSQSGQAIRSSTKLYKWHISRRALTFDTANYLQEAHLSLTLDTHDGKKNFYNYYFFIRNILYFAALSTINKGKRIKKNDNYFNVSIILSMSIILFKTTSTIVNYMCNQKNFLNKLISLVLFSLIDISQLFSLK